MAIHNSLVGTIANVADKLIDDVYELVPQICSLLDMPASRLEIAKSRDKTSLKRWIDAHGLRFLTTDFPRLGKAVDAVLSSPIEFPRVEGFRTSPLGVPIFLEPIWVCVLTGARLINERLTNHESADEITAEFAPFLTMVRSLCYCFYKLEVPYTDEQVAAKLLAFRDIENEMPDQYDDIAGVKSQWLITHAQDVLRRILGGDMDAKPSMKRRHFNFDALRPKHGPGAVATGEKDETKWEFTHKYLSLHREFPYYDFMYGIRSDSRALQLAARKQKYIEMKVHDVPTARMILVPKDSRGPRIISAEPLELQFVQQGVSRILMDYLQKHPDTRGRINFTDQTINGSLALLSSRTGEWATLDLSDASDRLSTALFLHTWPERLHRKFLALRSHYTLLPTGELLFLRKFAPMGSAICFPTESLTFWAICVASLMVKGMEYDVARRSVYVYGDDLIVPAEHYRDVADALFSVGLRVNEGKSFASGFFRESCGVDAFAGFRITPVRIKKLPSRRPHDGTAHAAWLAYAGRFADIGAIHTAMYIRELISGVIGFVPITSQPRDFLSIVTQRLPESFPSEFPGLRWNADLQYWEARLSVLRPLKRKTKLSDWERLNRNLLDPDPIAPDEVVEKDATIIIKRWCCTNSHFLSFVLDSLR